MPLPQVLLIKIISIRIVKQLLIEVNAYKKTHLILLRCVYLTIFEIPIPINANTIRIPATVKHNFLLL